MKRRYLEKKLRELGWKVLREGKKHSIWNHQAGREVAVPRHSEINEHTARAILKLAEVASDES